MSLEILEKVKNFLTRLVKDEAFRTQLMSDKIDEVIKVMEEGGYNFSQEEFETASIKILELKELGQFEDLSEEELVGAFGGLTSTAAQALYGVVVPPHEEPPILPIKPNLPIYPIHWIPRPRPPRPTKPWPPHPQPMYGIVIDPNPQPFQPAYGVIVSDYGTHI
ncbi:Nif11-like leader peptide family RiPP precursor [Nostoc sp. CHAB 5836]|uniref:Nif11-like leader peptide family RiPP precursor n=1 Tax=Nostoc sp. CHAB 5836 TaxID=2780404 RepID=UPI001E2E7614|nr:Nif11-like leader peptide family RiPP precursor [Nostoc sp. CHAB 5836]MCC5615172.1 Nif11-like leader peptide family RiPP precursor [Nostoc sp. CHAB 5836]